MTPLFTALIGQRDGKQNYWLAIHHLINLISILDEKMNVILSMLVAEFFMCDAIKQNESELANFNSKI